MRCAAIVPTCDRPELLKRALTTFYGAAAGRNLDIVRIVVADDSHAPISTSNIVHSLAAELPQVTIDYLPPEMGTEARSGPGSTRNRGLRHIVASRLPHDCVIMFDDDISFSDCTYQNSRVVSAGSAVLDDAAHNSSAGRTILGSSYVGRQDLSLLDHISLRGVQRTGSAEASTERGAVPLEAPGGVSGAFLFVTSPATELPEFLPWYNEDYFWLRRAKHLGWKLQCSEHVLAHAPEDGLIVSHDALLFEQYGEALWCASVEPISAHGGEGLHRAAIDSLQGRIAELHETRLALLRTTHADSYLISTLTSVALQLKNLLHDVTAGSKPCAFVKDLEAVIDYCGSPSI